MTPISAEDLDILIAHADADFAAQHLTEAMNGYRKVLASHPRHTHSLHMMGLACVQSKEIDEASSYLEHAIQTAPDSAVLWEHAGLVAAMKRSYLSAEAFYRRAIDLAGNTATLHRNLADCLRQLGRPVEAKVQFEKALAIEPDLHHAIRAIARISAELGEIDDAADYWMRAWTLDNSTLNDGLDLVAALTKARLTGPLCAAITQLRTRFSDDANALQSLAFVLCKNDRFGDTLDVARQGLAIDPQRGLLHHYAALALSTCGKIEESLQHCVEAARLTPDNPYIQHHLATIRLSRGEFNAGWQGYKAVYATSATRRTLVVPDFPDWNGEPVAGCRFLLVKDQGIGDEIQCIRFADWLHRQGATVDVLVSESVAPLAASLKGVQAVFTTMPPGPYEYWAHLLRIPEHMGLGLSTLPAISIPYLFATPEKVDHWRTYIETISPNNSHAARRRIGIVWAGEPRYPLDRFRSISLDAFIPLFELPEVTWFSLQKGMREQESERLENTFDVHTLGPDIADFTDTLAILQTLDLLITVDTSVAHLAGAAGRPVWLLVPAYAEWRWLKDRNDSPWYPSMRLFRQHNLADWEPVIEEVRDALQDWCCALS